MDQKQIGFFRRLLQGPFNSLMPIAAGASQGDLHSEALMRQLLREGRKQDAWDAPLVETRFVVVDTESTGFQPLTDALLSIGAVEMKGAEVHDQHTFFSLLRPDPFQTIPPHVSELLGIRDEEVATAPTLRFVLPQFLQFARDAVLVMHHAAHDVAFLNRVFRQTFKRPLPHRVLDTHDVAKWLLGNQLDRYSLDDLLAYYHIPVEGRHTALGDAKMTAVLWHHLVHGALERGVLTLGDLYEQVVLSKHR